MQDKGAVTGTMATNCLIIVHSYHHNNKAKIACEFSEVLQAKVVTLEEVILEKVQEYDLIGFGAGIDSGRHYQPLLDLVDSLPSVSQKAAFIFSTSAIQGATKVKKDHSLLRRKLESKGYAIVGEFSCRGLNTNLFLKFFGGMNKGRPNSEDFRNARKFALGLLPR